MKKWVRLVIVIVLCPTVLFSFKYFIGYNFHSGWFGCICYYLAVTWVLQRPDKKKEEHIFDFEKPKQ